MSNEKFDEAAFNEAISQPNGWDAVADPVAEIRRMRGDQEPTTMAKKDALLIASLLYYEVEDYAESIASANFIKVIKDACKRIGVKYEPFGPDMQEAIEARRKELQ